MPKTYDTSNSDEGRPGVKLNYGPLNRRSPISIFLEIPEYMQRTPVTPYQQEQSIYPWGVVSELEFLRCAIIQGDPIARLKLEHHYTESMNEWLFSHPHYETVRQWTSDEDIVRLAFERFWQTVDQQYIAYRALTQTARCLHASLNSIILELLRLSTDPDEEVGPELKVGQKSQDLWEIICTILPDAHQQRLAYLLYNCSLTPAEIIHMYPQEWNDEEIANLRHIILERLIDYP
ncbi:MAG: hypothetical protein NVS2B12_27170 [Ktedonobacteraceae bacterium]